MAFVRSKPHPISKKYRAGFTAWSGKQKLFTGTTNRAETLAMARRFEDEHRQIRLGYRTAPKSYDEAKRRLFTEVRDEYLAYGNQQGGHGGRPWGTVHARMRTSTLGWWTKHLGFKTLADLDGCLPRVEKALREYVCLPKKRGGTTRKPSGKTLQNLAESLRAFCIWATDRGYFESDPLDGLAPFDVTPQTQRRAISASDVTALLAKCAEHRRLLYEVAFASGLRSGELRALTTKHLDMERGGLRLDAAWTKNRKAAFHPLASWLMERLAAFAKNNTAAALYRQMTALYYKSGRPPTAPKDPLLYVPSHPARDLERDLVAAGQTKWGPGGKVDFHALRVAYVSFVLEAGATAKEAQTLARHSKPELTMNIYARARNDRLAEVAEAVALNFKPAAEAVAVKDGTTDQATALLRHQPTAEIVTNAVSDSGDTELVAVGNGEGKGFKSRRPDHINYCAVKSFVSWLFCISLEFRSDQPRYRRFQQRRVFIIVPLAIASIVQSFDLRLPPEKVTLRYGFGCYPAKKLTATVHPFFCDFAQERTVLPVLEQKV
jgi:integrase